MSIELVIPSNHLTLFCPLLLLPSVFPASGSFLMCQLFTSGSQSIGVSASASVLPKSSQGWFPLGLTSLISFQSKGLSRLFSNTTVQEHHFFSAQPSLWFSSHIHTWLLEKPRLWQYGSWLAKWCLCFLIHYVRHSFSFKEQASFNFMAAVTICSDFGAHKNKVSHCFHFFPCICHEVIGPDAMILVFLNVEF